MKTANEKNYKIQGRSTECRVGYLGGKPGKGFRGKIDGLVKSRHSVGKRGPGFL
jgi:hypothetical protein